MKINISFDVHEHKDSRGKKTGLLSCTVGASEIQARGKEALLALVRQDIEARSKWPEFCLVRGSNELRLLISHAGNTGVYKPIDDAPAEGIIPISYCTTWSNWDIKQEAESVLNHLMTAYRTPAVA